jgi:hypothetical protein
VPASAGAFTVAVTEKMRPIARRLFQQSANDVANERRGDYQTSDLKFNVLMNMLDLDLAEFSPRSGD